MNHDARIHYLEQRITTLETQVNILSGRDPQPSPSVHVDPDSMIEKRQPKTDPFEKWWGGIRDRYIMVICGNAMIKEGAARHIWDAALKWKEGK